MEVSFLPSWAYQDEYNNIIPSRLGKPFLGHEKMPKTITTWNSSVFFQFRVPCFSGEKIDLPQVASPIPASMAATEMLFAYLESGDRAGSKLVGNIPIPYWISFLFFLAEIFSWHVPTRYKLVGLLLLYFRTFCALVRSDAVANPRDVVAVVRISSCISETPISLCRESVRLVVKSDKIRAGATPSIVLPVWLNTNWKVFLIFWVDD